MIVFECPHCHKKNEIKSSDFRGSWWKPVRMACCWFCSTEFAVTILLNATEEQVKKELADHKKLVARDDPRLLISEFWVQVYFREKSSDYGITIVEPIRPNGPDFMVQYAGKPTMLEVENKWDDYLKHKHHLDERFYKSVTILVVLRPEHPPPILRQLLPTEIIHIRIEDFLAWKETEGPKFQREIAELEEGQHTSYQRSKLGSRETFALHLQELARPIVANIAPACINARDELVALLRAHDDKRVDDIAMWDVPMRSILVDKELLDPTQLAPRISERVQALFPEIHEKVNLKTPKKFVFGSTWRRSNDEE